MTIFTTYIQFNGKEYEAEVTGYHQPFECGTPDSPELAESFTVESIKIYPDIPTKDTVELMDLSWSFPDKFLEEIEKDFFTVLKGEEYV